MRSGESLPRRLDQCITGDSASGFRYQRDQVKKIDYLYDQRSNCKETEIDPSGGAGGGAGAVNAIKGGTPKCERTAFGFGFGGRGQDGAQRTRRLRQRWEEASKERRA
jgi:hypothetical protein